MHDRSHFDALYINVILTCRQKYGGRSGSFL